jgi:pimeloyl-ACP methyl ester carboxylesterase
MTCGPLHEPFSTFCPDIRYAPSMPIRQRLRGVLATSLLVGLIAACATPTVTPWTFQPDTSPTVPAAPSASAPVPSAGIPVADVAYTFVGSKPCPDDSRFTCTTLSVPRDHFTPGGPTWDVTFAIQRAAKTRIGTFVTITGGPGSSGISSADSYTDAYATAITDAYDIVFIDQRGIGLSGPIGCPAAVAAYYTDPTRPWSGDTAAYGAIAKGFVTDCLAESKVDTADLPYYATSQAIEDLEAIRQYLAVDKLDLYGESYGTQFVQTYAAAHPDHIRTLYIDGPVDLTIDGPTWYSESSRAANDTLVAALASCTADEACAAAVQGGDAVAVYDALAGKLGVAPIAFDFPTAKGTTESRELTIADLENAAASYLYSPYGRFLLVRAIVAASHEDYVPLARLAYDGIGLDPETVKVDADPTYSDMLYYAVECQDYAFYPDGADPDARLASWVARGTEVGVRDLRLGVVYYGDLPCLYWPSSPSTNTRPAPILDPPYTTFVMTADTDPATPTQNAMRIFSRLRDAYFILTSGGPHVIFGWGEACPDDLVSDYLATGTPPPTRITLCDGDVAGTYLSVAEPSAADYKDALDFATTMDDHLLNTDDYGYRYDGEEAIALGCDFGGTLTYKPGDAGAEMTMKGCAFTPGLAMTGTATTNDDSGAFELDVRIGGERIVYERDADGDRSVTGTYRGKRVDLEAAA